MKRSQSQEISYVPTATTSASALSRQAVSARPAASAFPARPSTPPASSYFSPFSGDHHDEPQPSSADAQAHFAYSTSFVRHRDNSLGLSLPPSATGLLPKFEDLKSVAEIEGAAGVWQRTVGTIRSWFASARREKDAKYEILPTHAAKEEEHRDTPSSVFAHYTVEVSVALTKGQFVLVMPSTAHVWSIRIPWPTLVSRRRSVFLLRASLGCLYNTDTTSSRCLLRSHC